MTLTYVDLDLVVVMDLDGDGGVDLVGGAVDRRVESGRNRERALPITRRMLSFQRLDVYQRAIEFLVLTTELTESLPRGHAERADQLIRAAESWCATSLRVLGAGRMRTARSTTRSRAVRRWSARRRCRGFRAARNVAERVLSAATLGELLAD